MGNKYWLDKCFWLQASNVHWLYGEYLPTSNLFFIRILNIYKKNDITTILLLCLSIVICIHYHIPYTHTLYIIPFIMFINTGRPFNRVVIRITKNFRFYLTKKKACVQSLKPRKIMLFNSALSSIQRVQCTLYIEDIYLYNSLYILPIRFFVYILNWFQHKQWLMYYLAIILFRHVQNNIYYTLKMCGSVRRCEHFSRINNIT